MELMRAAPDNAWDLAICDPPYGINENGSTNHSRGKCAKAKQYKSFAGGDKEPPSTKYFNELRRVSKNQIIWGANHFIDRVPVPSSCWVVWDKINGATDFADCELAWTSFKSAVRQFRYRWQGMLQGDMKNKEHRIHPTQKPVALYKWLLQNYAKEGDKILDTHGGSMSIAIACGDAGYELTLSELDKDYFNAGVERVKAHFEQLDMFVDSPTLNYHSAMMERIDKETREQELF
jgi:site-specific DNA-methyltransferase (adenine-specific)